MHNKVELKIDTKTLFDTEDQNFHKQLTKALLSAFGYRHKWYKRTVDKARFYKAVATGEGQEYLIVNYKPKETEKQKLNRIEITKSKTKSVTNKIVSQFDRIYRQPRILDSFDYADTDAARTEKTQRLNAELKKVLSGGGIDMFLKDHFINVNTVDPNAFLFVFSYLDEMDVLQHELSIQQSANVLDYKYKNNVLKYITVGDMQENKRLVLSYTQDYFFTITAYKNLKRGQRPETDYDAVARQNEWTVYIKVELNESGTVPAMRLGVCKDVATMMETCVSIIDPAENEFRDLINRKSEYDLTIQLHVFPQKVQKGEPCTYINPHNNDKCRMGQLALSGSECPSCKGSGLQVMTSAQDALIIRPVDPKTNQPLSVNDYAKYVDLPFNIVEHQHDIIHELPSQISEAIFGVDIAKITNAMNPATATETLAKVDSMNAVLAKYAAYKAHVKQFAIYQIAYNSSLSENLAVSIKAPQQFKILDLPQLFVMLKQAKDAGAPADIIERIEKDIREKQNEDNQIRNVIEAVKSKFQPFKSLSKDLAESIVFSLPDTNRDRVLYLYSDRIYRNLEMNQKPVFLQGDMQAQERAINAEIDKIIEELNTNNSLSFIGNQNLENEADNTQDSE